MEQMKLLLNVNDPYVYNMYMFVYEIHNSTW